MDPVEARAKLFDYKRKKKTYTRYRSSAGCLSSQYKGIMVALVLIQIMLASH